MTQEIKNYYIATGQKRNYFTLRAQQTRYSAWGNPYEVDVHIRNLSIDKATAVAKARGLLGYEVPVDPTLETSPFDSSPSFEIDYSVLHFGKYQGRSVAEIADEDPDYLVYVVDNDYVPTKASGNIAHIKALLATEFADLEQHKAELAARQAASTNRLESAFGKEWLECNAANGGNFLQSVCGDILNGVEPSERALDILVDIRAKDVGRRNSKAYNKAYAAIEQALS